MKAVGGMRRLERVKTGIERFDEIIGGGFPKGATVLVTGGTGTGKTTFAIQFLVEGLKNGENGLLITCEEEPDRLYREMEQFGWDLKKFEEEGKLVVIDVASTKAGMPTSTKYREFQPRVANIDMDLVMLMGKAIREKNVRRVVVDSVPALALRVKGAEALRELLFRIYSILERFECTSVVITEIAGGGGALSRYGVEEFLSSGVIKLSMEKEEGKWVRKIQVVKMRGTKHDLNEHVFKITEKGIEVE
ncbi:MAG: ATPase domain-containing protein [Candidatus Freyarchaeota archaeon]